MRNPSAQGPKAARMHAGDTAVHIELISLGEAGPGEVTVEMHMAGVNPLDTYVLGGKVGSDAGYPRTLGVEGVGMHAGRMVVVSGAGVGTVRDGTWSEVAVVPIESLVEVPDGVTIEQAAACGVAGATAIRVVQDLAKPTKEDRVLVLAASGSVGAAACSLLASAGFQTWGQTTSHGKSSAVGALGATPLVAQSPQELAALLQNDVRPTVVLDALGGEWTTSVIEALALGGRLISYGTSAGAVGTINLQSIYRKGLTWHGYGGIAEHPGRIRDAITRALNAIASAELLISTREPLPIERAQEAIDLVRTRDGFGKVLLDLRS